MNYQSQAKCRLAFLAALLLVPVQNSFAAQDETSLFPPNAEPGKCYAKVLIPAKFKTVTEELIKREPSEKITLIPEQWDWIEEKILVKEAEEKLEVVPASYKIVEEKIVVEQASSKLEVVEPVYATVEETVVDKPARTVWKKGSGLFNKVDNATGDIMCLINEPETYKKIQKQVVKSPASVKKVDIPEKYKIIKKKVIDKPAEVKKVTVPAEYMTIKVKKLVAPAKEQRTPIPQETQIVSKMVKENDEKMAWQPVLCETNMTKEVMVKIQKALAEQGFYSGKVDGSIGGGTLKALEGFQQKNNLARGGLTYETLKALNVAIY